MIYKIKAISEHDDKIKNLGRTPKTFALLIIVAFMQWTTANAQDDEYSQAFSVYQTQDFEKATKIWTDLAVKGDINAQYALGVMELRGETKEPSLEQAFRWFESAASQGHSTAMFNVGVAYWEGSGVEKDRNKALKWWEESANNGDSGAQFNLGLAYYIGNVRPANLDVAAKWISLAAKQNHPEANRILKIIAEENSNIDISSSASVAENNTTSETNDTDSTLYQSNDEPVTQTLEEESTEITKVAVEVPESKPKEVYWRTNSSIPLRTEANTTSPVFYSLPTGTPIEIVITQGDWSQITLPAGLKLWVYAQYIQVEGTNGVIKGTNVRVRPKPDTNNETSPPVGVYKNGDRVKVLDKSGEWYQIRAPKHIGGWVISRNIEQYNDAPENRDHLWETMMTKGL